jgi:hypothetical protein
MSQYTENDDEDNDVHLVTLYTVLILVFRYCKADLPSDIGAQSDVTLPCILLNIHHTGKYLQGDSNMTGTDLCVNKPHSVPVIFEPPCKIRVVDLYLMSCTKFLYIEQCLRKLETLI